MPIRPARTLAQALLLSAALSGAAFAQEGEEGREADPVVATVNGAEILRSEVVQAIQNLPEQYRQVPVEVLIPAIAEQVAIGRLIIERAEEAGLASDPEVRERLQQARTNVLQEAWLQRQVEERMTDEAVEEAYQAYLEANPPADEVKARHILVETEAEAEALIDQLDQGAEFGALAEEHSIGPSGEAGGDLGWFGEGQMVQPFGEVAFAMEPGNYTEDPVETQFGWHVIEVQDRRTVEPPSLDELRDQLESQLAQGYIQQIIEDVRAGADIQLVGAEEDEGDEAGAEEGEAEGAEGTEETESEPPAE